jgi:hypothetical protein
LPASFAFRLLPRLAKAGLPRQSAATAGQLFFRSPFPISKNKARERHGHAILPRFNGNASNIWIHFGVKEWDHGFQEGNACFQGVL